MSAAGRQSSFQVVSEELEVCSTSSSEISDSLRCEILGAPYCRRPKEKKPCRRALKDTSSANTVLRVETKENNPLLENPANDILSAEKKRSFENKVEVTQSWVNIEANAKAKKSRRSLVEAISNQEKEIAGFGSKHSENKRTAWVQTDSNHRSIRSISNIEESETLVNVVDSRSSNKISTPMSNRIPGEQTPSSTSRNCKYATVETQTIAIQTVAVETESDTNCRCRERKKRCSCSACEPRFCRYGEEDSLEPPGYISEASTDNDLTESTQTRHKHDSNWDTSDTERTSDVSDDSLSTDFFELSYQNNQEYMELLQELEKKLIARNRERVRRTMLEFEKRSRLNQNLDRPVVEYGRGDDASILKKLKQRQRNQRCCCKCKGSFRSDILQNEKRWEELDFDRITESPRLVKGQKLTKLEGNVQRSHWRLDNRTGEWVKVGYETDEYSTPYIKRDDADVEMIKPPPPCKGCRCSKAHH